MKEVTLSTGQVAVIRTKDELTEGQSRKISIARSRHDAVLQRYRKPLYLDEAGKETFEVTSAQAMIDGSPKLSVPAAGLDGLSDEEWDHIYGLTDALISALTVTLDGQSVSDPTTLSEAVHDALSEAVSEVYTGVKQQSESVDDKIDPLAEAAESTDSSTAAAT